MVETKKEGYFISPLYQGGYSSLDPDKSGYYTGQNIPIRQLAITTDPSVAAVEKEFSDKINLGMEHIEVEALDPRVFDAMPKQQLKEINRLSKLTGVDISFHGPLVEPSGMSQHGWNEATRKAAENQIREAMERMYQAKPENVIVNFHTSNMLPSSELMKTKEGEKVEGILIVNSETGSINKIPLKERFFPGEDKKATAEKEIENINEELWDEGKRHLAYNGDRAIEYITHSQILMKTAEAEKRAGKKLEPEEIQATTAYNAGVALLDDSYRQLKELYERAWKHGKEEDKRKLTEFADEIQSQAEKIKKNPRTEESINLKKDIVDKGLRIFKDISPPEIIQDANVFMMEKSAETFGNAAYGAYKKFKDKAPIMVIENPPANQQFSRGEDVKNMVVKAREQFIVEAKKEGMSESQAREKAEEIIGATWDVGHINMLRKYGFEEKDIIKETEKIAPYLKHIHLSDNFGFEHTELPMGMGNVPLKEIMDKLGKKGYEAKKIIEAGDWWTKHLPKGGGPPIAPSLEGLGSPIYSVGGAPYWNQVSGFYQGYSGGFGQILPQGHYNILGAGFSQLPAELGGQMPGQQGSRMSGKPME